MAVFRRIETIDQGPSIALCPAGQVIGEDMDDNHRVSRPTAFRPASRAVAHDEDRATDSGLLGRVLGGVVSDR